MNNATARLILEVSRQAKVARAVRQCVSEVKIRTGISLMENQGADPHRQRPRIVSRRRPHRRDAVRAAAKESESHTAHGPFPTRPRPPQMTAKSVSGREQRCSPLRRVTEEHFDGADTFGFGNRTSRDATKTEPKCSSFINLAVSGVDRFPPSPIAYRTAKNVPQVSRSGESILPASLTAPRTGILARSVLGRLTRREGAKCPV